MKKPAAAAAAALIILFVFFPRMPANANDDKSRLNKIYSASDTQEGGKKGRAYRLFFNNLNIPINNSGAIANVDIADSDGQNSSDGTFDGINFLFSGGFYLAGLQEGIIWTAGNMSANRIADTEPGTYAYGSEDPRAQIYVLKRTDGDFHQSWTDWIDAVALGAKFYDGDGNGIYNPVDKNGNGKWDADEDKPDLIGDETVWCVFKDSNLDRGSMRAAKSMGIEIRQTIFGYKSYSDLGNILFIRYELLNTGLVADELDSVYFSFSCDQDLGAYENDLAGCDTLLNAGFGYDLNYDARYGNSPCFLVDLVQGPFSFLPGMSYNDLNNNGIFDEGIDEVLDTAYQNYGPQLGIKKIPGAANLPMTSFNSTIKSHPTYHDPYTDSSIYSSLKGLDNFGDPFDPCAMQFGEFRGGVDCSKANPKFLYSGDPVADYGWIKTRQTDTRLYVNSGPFKLNKGEPVEIIGAYVMGRAETSLLSVNEAKRIDKLAQYLLDNNFSVAASPPEVLPKVFSAENAIKLLWETFDHADFSFRDYDEFGSLINDLRFEGFEVYMYRTPSTQEAVNGQTNKIKIASYDIRNKVGNVYYEDIISGERKLLFEKGNQLDSLLYGNHQTGRIELEIDKDPFTNAALVKGKTYYISVVSYALNQNFLEKLYPQRSDNDYYTISPDAFIGYTTSEELFINGRAGIVLGDDMNIPVRSSIELKHIRGTSDAAAVYSIIDHENTKNNDYEVGFIKDSSSQSYKLLWRVTNQTSGEVVLDSVDVYNQKQPVYLADGVLLDIEWLQPKLLDETSSGISWLKPERAGTGAIYIGVDIDTNMFAGFINNGSRSSITTFENVRKVELRFGQQGMAYRYVKSDGSLKYLYRQDDPVFGSGFVEVPFTAWVKDEKYGEEYQLAVGYLERMPSEGDTANYNDEKWNPGYDMSDSHEYIVIFSSPYDPAGGNVVYTGTGTGSVASKNADITSGYLISRADPNYIITDSMAAVAKSPWFDAMYLVALELDQSVDLNNFNPAGTYTININYPLTEADKFTYTPSIKFSSAEKKNLFDKINVYPNPFFGINGLAGDDPEKQFITFINLPEKVDINIYTLAGSLVRTLNENDKSNLASPFIKWDLRNENGLRVGSGMFMAVVGSPGLGKKILKFSVIQGKNFKAF